MLPFKLSQSSREIIELVEAFFGCGSITEKKTFKIGTNKTYMESKWSVGNLPDLLEKVIPLFKENLLVGKKKRDFDLFAYAVEFRRARKEGSRWEKSEIRELQTEMTYAQKTQGECRKFSKTETLVHFNQNLNPSP